VGQLTPAHDENIMQLELTSIRTDGGTQPRATYHYGIADAYAEDMEAGANFPPIVVFFDGSDYWLADGFHRVLAARKVDRSEIEADVRQGTLQDAQWYSYSVNQSHGLRRSNEDKQRAVEAALAHPKAAGMSDRDIAEHVGVDHKTVSARRNRVTGENPQSTENGYRKGKDGVKRKTPKKKPAAPKTAPEPEDEEPLTPYEKAVAAQYHQNGVSTPIVEPDPDEMFDAILTRFSDGFRQLIRETLPNGLDANDFQRIMDIIAQNIAANVEG
jgi:hypothetical protein